MESCMGLEGCEVRDGLIECEVVLCRDGKFGVPFVYRYGAKDYVRQFYCPAHLPLMEASVRAYDEGALQAIRDHAPLSITELMARLQRDPEDFLIIWGSVRRLIRRGEVTDGGEHCPRLEIPYRRRLP